MEGFKIVLICLTPLFVSFGLGVILYVFKNKSIFKFTEEMKALERETKKYTETEILFYKNLAKNYRAELDAYKLGLGLFPGDRKKAAEELWERAAIGDETAYYVLLELLDAELDLELGPLPEIYVKTDNNHDLKKKN